MVKVIAHKFIQLDALDKVKPIFQELVEKTRLEKDCLEYQLFENQKVPGHFTFVEAWPNQAALENHFQTEHFKRLVPMLNALQRSEGEVLLLNSVF